MLRGRTPTRRRHGTKNTPGGATSITVTASAWQEQFNELWKLLVPAGGSAETEQGEAIRLAGKLSREILDNGGINWDADFCAMADALTARLASRKSVTGRRELARLRKTVRTGRGDQTTLYRLTELTVAWVLANPDPAPLTNPPYQR